jgi:hypothetical protein
MEASLWRCWRETAAAEDGTVLYSGMMSVRMGGKAKETGIDGAASAERI